jgi:hypothetical protein
MNCGPSCHSSLVTLFRFFVRAMHPAVIAELLEFKTVGRLLFILRGDVIPVLALGALQRDVISCHNSSFQTSPVRLIIGRSGRQSIFGFRLLEPVTQRRAYSRISETVPAPTVLPPSRIANLNPFSIAIGLINSISNCELSPGITISTPSGNCATPVTSVVRK